MAANAYYSCGLVENGTGVTPTDLGLQGYVEAECDHCKRKIWRGPFADAFLKKYPDGVVCCLQCAAEAVEGTTQ